MKKEYYLPLFWLFVISYAAGCNQIKDSSQSQNNNRDLIGNSSDKKHTSHYDIQKQISHIDTSPGWHQNGQKVLVTGTVFQQDAVTPAKDIIVYYYHTNTEGRYVHKPGEKRSMAPNNLGQTHGYIRGWVKTDSNGKYAIYTVRPGAYPDGSELAHIHLTVKEQDIPEYYIDDIVFDDDKLLTTKRRLQMQNRAGSGIIRLIKRSSLLIGERNIYTGLNIPDYPKKKPGESDKGKKIGEDIMSFTPYHAWGPDKGSKACPICKYGRYHGILYFVGHNPDWPEIKQWLNLLEAESKTRGKYLKVYFVYGNEAGYNKDIRRKELENLGKELQIETTALTFVPSFSDVDSDVYSCKIDAGTENTFLLYKRSQVIGKYVNLKPTVANMNMIIKRLDATVNEYFKF